MRSPLVLALFAALLLPAAPAEPAEPMPNFGFSRPINPAWFPDDPRQWSGYSRSVLLTDLATAEPSAALSADLRRKGKWKIIPYETKDFKGRALCGLKDTDPAPVRLALGATGWHAVYVGIGTSPRTAGVMRSGAMAKLHSHPYYRRIGNNFALAEPRRDVVQEQFIAVANLKPGESIDLAPMAFSCANLMYVRLVPLTEEDRLAWEREGRDHSLSTATAEFDGHSWIWNYRPRTAQDLLGSFEGYQHSDFGQWWFCVLGVDLACYPSKIATIPGEHTEDFPDEAYAEFTRSVKAMVANGVNPLLLARAEAKKQGRDFHVFVRPEAWGASIPFEETFDSHLFRDHPEWREVDRDGRAALFMSYAVPEVRQKSIDVLREAVEACDPEGIGFYFNRGVPLMLWEKPFADRFRSEYGIAIMSVSEDDARIRRLRASIMTGYLRSVRAMLGREGLARGGKRYAVTAVAFADKKINDEFGLDIETWAKEGLVDQLALAPCQYYGTAPYDVPYYHRAVAGTKVKVYPYVIAWKTELWNGGDPSGLCRLLLKYHDEKADGVAVWDQAPEDGYRKAHYDGNVFDLVEYAGHRDLIAYWAQHGVPVPNHIPLQKFGENEYSKWWPNTGY